MKNNILKAFKDTLNEEMLSLATCENIIKQMTQNGVINNPHSLFNTDGDSSYLIILEDESKNKREELLHYLCENNEITIKEISNYFFHSQYDYSVLFEPTTPFPNYDKVKSELTIDGQKVEKSFGESIDSIEPRIIKDDAAKTLTLQYNLIKKGYKPTSGDNKRTIVYTVLVIVDFTNNVVEFRYNTATSLISNSNQNFYVSLVNDLRRVIDEKLLNELTPLILSPIINEIKKDIDLNANHEISVSAQAYNYAQGSKVVLDTGNDDNLSLPLLGNIKAILNEHETLLKTNSYKKLSQDLEDIISQAEETSSHPWITLRWPTENKNKATKVKFSFNYLGQDFDVLYFYTSSLKEEWMTNVRNILCDKKQELNHPPNSTPTDTIN